VDFKSLLRRPTALVVPIVVGLVVAGAAVVLTSGGSGGSSHKSVSANHATIQIMNFMYMPMHLTVKAGTKVTFTNQDSTEHTATSETPGGFDTGTLQPGHAVTIEFSKPGVYPYHCLFHAFMTASITVTQ
jgi:plastocyanin